MKSTLDALEEAITRGHNFVFICDMGGGKIQVSGPCDREWLVEVLTGVLAGATHKPHEQLLEKVVSIDDHKSH